MSELIKQSDNRATIRWKLLTGASALAIAASTPSMAGDDSGHPLLWIEIGGDADMLSGFGDRFSAPFLEQTPTPTPYLGGSPVDLQKPPRYSFGGDATVALQPQDSDWIFSAGIRYGRSSNKRDVHHQTGVTTKFPNPEYLYFKNNNPVVLSYYPSIIASYPKYAAKFAQTTVNQSEKHLVLDFQAGKDVGLGMFGKGGTSVLSAGVRVARFTSHTDVLIRAKPNVDFYSVPVLGSKYNILESRWSTYYLHGQAKRSFSGIGPSLSWSASAPLAGNVQDGQLSLDWGLNGAVLFGRQRAKVSHQTTRRDLYAKYSTPVPPSLNPVGFYEVTHYFTNYKHRPPAQIRSRNVTVPNFGATIGLSYRIEDAKLSIGYRADYFFGAMDGGIDRTKKTTLGFNGFFASISIGIGD